jgi:hypothetical protein
MTAEQVGEVCVTMADFDVSVVNVVGGSHTFNIFFLIISLHTMVYYVCCE